MCYHRRRQQHGQFADCRLPQNGRACVHRLPEGISARRAGALVHRAVPRQVRHDRKPGRSGGRMRTSFSLTCGLRWGRRKKGGAREGVRGYQINAELLAKAHLGCMVQHCLPAHRGEEITADVFESHADQIFDEAENRLHAQKAVMVAVMGTRKTGKQPRGFCPNRKMEETSMKGYLLLANGQLYEGTLMGAAKPVMPELVFTTAMTGYLETLTDPSTKGKSSFRRSPTIGNYGVIPEDFESPRPRLSAYIVRELCDEPSNFRCQGKLDDYLKAQGIPCLTGWTPAR